MFRLFKRKCDHDFYVYLCGCRVCRKCDGYIFGLGGCSCYRWWKENRIR